MDLTNLTKKNQEFIHIATNQLIEDGKSDEEIQAILEEVLPTIIENQKKGLTARALLGAPTVWAASFTEKASESLLFLMHLWDSSIQQQLALGFSHFLPLVLVGVLLCTQLTTSSIASLVNLRANDQVGKKLSLYLV